MGWTTARLEAASSGGNSFDVNFVSRPLLAQEIRDYVSKCAECLPVSGTGNGTVSGWNSGVTWSIPSGLLFVWGCGVRFRSCDGNVANCRNDRGCSHELNLSHLEAMDGKP